ncbi:MAG: PorV/PorQ family protein [Elusimicrobiota bacterium]
MRTILLAVIALLAALEGRAGDFSRGAAGTSGSQFLTFDTSARGIAMAGAYVTASDDASSIYWNPAGLTRVRSVSATVLHAPYLADITYNAAAAALRMNHDSVVAAGLRYLDMGSIPETDVNGLPRGDFHPRAYVAELAWGQHVPDLSETGSEFSLGANIKYLQTDIGARASAVAGDIGLLSRIERRFIYDMGVTVQNIGSGQKFDKVRDSLPTRVRVGAGIRPIKPLLLTIEGIAPFSNALHGAAGAEYTLTIDEDIQTSARAGFNSLTYQSLGPSSALSMGFGVTAFNLSFDYAFAPSGELGAAIHRISLSFNLPELNSIRSSRR